MGVNLLEENNDQVTIETVGAVISHPYFIQTFLITSTSAVLLLVMSIGNYWPHICQQPDGALFGILGAVYTLSITGSALLVSTILVDDCSWFFKFFTLFSSSILYISCGTYHLYGYFRKTMCISPVSWNFSLINVTGLKMNNCYEDLVFETPSAWTPLLIFASIFAGVVYFLFSVYLFLTFDAN